MSRWMSVLSGVVPQGSVLGALLFFIYINYLYFGILNELLKFADDTKILRRVEDEMDSDRILKDLDMIVSWPDKWGMEFNMKKCKLTHVLPRR